MIVLVLLETKFFRYMYKIKRSVKIKLNFNWK